MEERSPARSPVSFASGYADAPAPLLVCFSHLRWDFVWQRPQHLLSRAAKHYRVLQIEEPLFEKGATPRMDVSKRARRHHHRDAGLARGLERRAT